MEKQNDPYKIIFIYFLIPDQELLYIFSCNRLGHYLLTLFYYL